MLEESLLLEEIKTPSWLCSSGSGDASSQLLLTFCSDLPLTTLQAAQEQGKHISVLARW